MKADCHSPLSAWTPCGALPIAVQTVPIAPAPVLGGSRSCALVSNPRVSLSTRQTVEKETVHVRTKAVRIRTKEG